MSGCPRILVVAGDGTFQADLAALLQPAFEIVQAHTGAQAEAVLQACGAGFGAVLLDDALPVHESAALAATLKSIVAERFVPVLLMLSSPEAEQRFGSELGAWADDYLCKSSERGPWLNKLRALSRLSDISAQNADARGELQRFDEQAKRDYKIAHRVFDTIVARSCLWLWSIRYCAQALENFSGDLVMAAPVSATRMRLFLGDCSGHGLSAAICAMPISDVFYATAERDVPLPLVLRELNFKVRQHLPRHMFLAAFIAELDTDSGRLVAWNGGMPDVYVLRADGSHRLALGSLAPALGVLAELDGALPMQVIDLERGARIFACSDGVIEAAAVDGTPFASTRLKEELAREPGRRFMSEHLEQTLVEFRGGQPAQDDITFVELAYDDVLCADLSQIAAARAGVPATLRSLLRLDLGVAELRRPDLIEYLSQQLDACEALAAQRRAAVSAVVLELVRSVIDHALLSLGTELELLAPQAFERQRRARAAELATGQLSVAVIDRRRDHVRELVIVVTHDGPADRLQRGRGLALIEALCCDVAYLDGARTIEVTISRHETRPSAP